VIDQDPPHELRGESDELRTALPGNVPLIDQPQVSLMNQGRTLQGVICPLGAQLPVGKPAELAINERHQLAERTLVAGGPVDEQLCYPAVRGFIHIVAKPAFTRATRNRDYS
jgi:hypothetical protein